MSRAIIATVLATSVPTLPVVHGDHLADEIRRDVAHQIIAHEKYTHHIRQVWRARRQAEAAALAAQRAAETPPPGDAPTASPTTGGAAPSYSSDGWGDELAAVGFPASAIPTMLGYIARESGGDPSAINPSSQACGLTQIYPYVPGCLDPMTNLRLAYEKYQASGFAPWGG